VKSPEELTPEKDETLIIDADDTLWENNVFYERATDRFLVLVESRGFETTGVRERLLEIERTNVRQWGYGSQCFARSLRETLESFGDNPATAQELTIIESLAEGVANIPIEFLPGVQKTLVRLRVRFRLILFTKGHPPEQWQKVERSGVQPLFDHVEVTTEKNTFAYTRLIERYRLTPSRTWMVGNSPASDVKPALAAGMNAILIPHPHTWALEHEEVAEHVRLTVLERFEDLLGAFPGLP
jgi:putative hydrolase of the HAD superfamily